MGRKTRGSRNCKSKILIFAIQFLHPRQSGAHGTCHACHTLDTSLVIARGVTRLNGARARSLAPPFSNLKSFGSNCTLFMKVLVTLPGLFGALRSDSAPWKFHPLCPPCYAPGHSALQSIGVSTQSTLRGEKHFNNAPTIHPSSYSDPAVGEKF